MHGMRWGATKHGIVLAIALLAAGPQSVRGQNHAATTSQAVSDNCTRSGFRVVVDVGHTLDVPGAMSARGVPEYTFNLQLAREVKQALVDAGFEQTVLLITGTTLINDTLEELLHLARPAARVTMVGPTVSLLPDAFLRRGADILGTVRITAPDEFLETLAEGGSGYHFLGRSAQKVVLVRRAAADAAA